jgi:signal transduction histidine kinase
LVLVATHSGSASPGIARPARFSVGEPSRTETYGLALGAVGAAVLTLTVDSRSVVTIAMLAVALLPWGLTARGVRLPLWLFALWAMAPAAIIIAVEEVGAPIFLGILTVFRVFSATANVPLRVATALAALSLCVLSGAVGAEAGQDEGAAYFMAGVGVGALTGYQSHRQRELTAELQWSLARLDEAATAEERRRIAREVHDVVAHSLTVVLLNVGGARKALASHPELAGEALDRAEQVGRDSLDGIRRIVGLLRTGGEALGPPEPTAGDVRSIVEEQRQVGADIDLTVVGELETVEPLAGAALARIAREALTNAQRHAPGAPVRVEVVVRADRVSLDISNGAARQPRLDRSNGRQGLGLLGMRERVEALGGEFTAGPHHGGWRVAGAIPLTPRRASSIPVDGPP